MNGGRGSGPSDATVLTLIGLALVIGVAVWVWGGLAGLLFGSGWPPIGAGQTFGVLVRLPARLADPAQAWPRQVRGRLPGAPGVYATLGLLAAARDRARRSGVTVRPGRGAARPARWGALGDAGRVAPPVRVGRRTAGAGAQPWSTAVHRAAPRVGGVRTAPVREVGRAGGAGVAGMGWAGGGVVDQDRSAGLHDRAAPRAGRRVRVRPVRAVGRINRTRGRRWRAPTAGTAHLRSHGDSRRRANLTRKASRAATSGRSRLSSGWHHCSTWRRAPMPEWTRSCAGPTGRGRETLTRRSRS